eukprot:SAG31_NODE_11211_length_1053_cov_1.159329_1_plen_31_part_10
MRAFSAAAAHLLRSSGYGLFQRMEAVGVGHP